MFFLEPFVRQEEEQQAYARCHRFGQEHSVHAKVYFTPVSIESRLLEWRKQVATASRPDTKVVYTDLMEVDEGSDDEDLGDAGNHDELDEQDDTAQTLFLLGLQ
jgi:SNF2 family DNA or RNA helicase